MTVASGIEQMCGFTWGGGGGGAASRWWRRRGRKTAETEREVAGTKVDEGIEERVCVGQGGRETTERKREEADAVAEGGGCGARRRRRRRRVASWRQASRGRGVAQAEFLPRGC
jgi:hypothetical protein